RSGHWSLRGGCLFVRCRRIDDGADGGDLVGGEARLLGMFPDQLSTWRVVDAVDLVTGHVTMDPLNFRAHLCKYAVGVLGCVAECLFRHVACTCDFTFDQVLSHCLLLAEAPEVGRLLVELCVRADASLPGTLNSRQASARTGLHPKDDGFRPKGRALRRAKRTGSQYRSQFCTIESWNFCRNQLALGPAWA